MGKIERDSNSEIICSPEDGTWEFGEILRKAFAERKRNWVLDVGVEIGTVSYFEILDPNDINAINYKVTQVIAEKRGFVRDVLADDGDEVAEGDPLLHIRVLRDSAI